MLNFKVNHDPEKALSKTKNILSGKGLLGWFTKLLIGKEDLHKMNMAVGQAQQTVNSLKELEHIRQVGVQAKAHVIAIQDTGMLLNYNPVVQLMLEVHPAAGAPYTVGIRTPVSKIAIPRVGDQVVIKYDPADQMKVALI
ncbi:MAG: hypothetical protein CMR00_06725 [[Chlorobium] sp. 445]|nr:MAG: hypothetical protein CMR00_06725 [[Chlorobium] sp. 445]